MLYTVTCRTSNCVNENIEIEFLDPAAKVYCGPCGIEITDKKVVS